MKKIIRKADLIAICLLLAAAAVFFGMQSLGSDAKTAEIICDNEVIQTLDLQHVKEDYEIALPNGMIIAVADGKISVAASNCADKLCMQCGSLTKDGDTAVCLPNRTLIRVTGQPQDGTPDVITY